MFPEESQALTACIAIQKRLQEKPVLSRRHRRKPVQMQMGIESGEVVEIEGDCYGDAVNSAARLADLAGADQILTTQRVRDALPPDLQAKLRSLGPMYLRGKAEATEVYRVQWQAERDAEATVMGVSMFGRRRKRTWRLTVGRPDAATGPARRARSRWAAPPRPTCSINDSRVSRVHATVEWRGGHFMLSDASSFGTWVYMSAARPSRWCCAAPSATWSGRARSPWAASVKPTPPRGWSSPSWPEAAATGYPRASQEAGPLRPGPGPRQGRDGRGVRGPRPQPRSPGRHQDRQGREPRRKPQPNTRRASAPRRAPRRACSTPTSSASTTPTGTATSPSW